MIWKAKLALMSWRPVKPPKGRSGLFKPKKGSDRYYLDPFKIWIGPNKFYYGTFFSIWPIREPRRIYQFGPNKVQCCKWLIVRPKLSRTDGSSVTIRATQGHKDWGVWKGTPVKLDLSRKWNHDRLSIGLLNLMLWPFKRLKFCYEAISLRPSFACAS